MIAIESGRGWVLAPSSFEAVWATTRWGESPLYCNIGGPMSRSRKLVLRSTILGEGSDRVVCPRVRSVALDFGKKNPVTYVRRLSERLGYRSPEAARDALLGIFEPCICCVSKEIEPARVEQVAPEVLLEQALVLGLSTSALFDPTRPVIWTRTSLTRRLHLYEIGGFYA